MKSHVFLPIALLLLAAICITGCSRGLPYIVSRGKTITVQGQSTETSVARETVDKETSVPTAEPQEEHATMGPAPTAQATGIEPPADAEQLVRLAQEDLAQKLGLAPEAIRLVSVEAVNWPDTSLGCPQPGMMYAQVITLGFRVVLEVEGKKYEYHTDAGRFVVLCGGDGLPFDPVPLMPVAPHGVPGKPRMPAD